MIWSKLRAKIESFFARLSYRNWCYTQMEERGSACKGKCNGQFGGTSSTGYLSETCVDCKYLNIKVLSCK